MIGVRTNASAAAKRYALKRRRFRSAVRRGARAVAIAINRIQVANLSGSGSAAPGSYPVPVRSGTLRRGSGWKLLSDTSGAVFNLTSYARKIHSTRQFLHDAVRSTDKGAIMAASLRGVFS